MVEAELLLRRADQAELEGDLAQARAFFARAAELGDPVAWTRLGLLFDYGLGVSVDKNEAMRCYRRAWRARSTAAANNIAVLYRERGDRRRAFRWMARSAEAGDGDAWVDLAKCYRDGDGVRRSPASVMRCLAAALASEHSCEAAREEAAAMMTEVSLHAV